MIYQILKLKPQNQQEWDVPLSDSAEKIKTFLSIDDIRGTVRHVELWKLRDLYELIYASNLTWMYLENVDDHMQTLKRRFDFIDNSIELISKLYFCS